MFEGSARIGEVYCNLTTICLKILHMSSRTLPDANNLLVSFTSKIKKRNCHVNFDGCDEIFAHCYLEESGSILPSKANHTSIN
eukprot:UN06967